VKEKEQEPFAGPIPTVRAAVARAMAGALERETLRRSGRCFRARRMIRRASSVLKPKAAAAFGPTR
jgi:N-methylhydantoinase B/oxoprolinase/acetone carboxylase alpha subunit